MKISPKMKKLNLYSRVKRFDILTSTNDYTAKLANSDEPAEGTVIMADFQTDGKGQKNASWISEKGSNLTFSIIIYPAYLNPANNFYLSMALSLGIVDMLRLNKIYARIKWPNDVFTNKGKIAGILIENAIQGDKIKSSILGIGLNVNQEIFPDEITNCTSMRIELKTIINREIVLRELLESVEYWFGKLYDQDFGFIKNRYEQLLLFKNQCKIFYSGGDYFSGTIKGINESGQLFIEDENHVVRTFGFKEVEYCF
jgi:BirA family biotin operon repressor/biotin-[acetyl-CoA-carboxylase] ligase